jgi:hypothetical protein
MSGKGKRTFTAEAEEFLDSVLYKGNTSEHLKLANLLNNYGYRTQRGALYNRKHIGRKVESSTEWKTRAARENPSPFLFF